MNQQDLIRNIRSYPVASVAITVTIILILALYLRSAAQDDLQKRFDEATKSWNSIEENVFKNSVNLETHLEQVEAVSQDVRERLIRPSQLAQNYQYFYRLEASTGVKIQNLQQQAAAAPAEQGGAQGQSKAPAPLSVKVGYGMNVTGSFSQLLDLLYALEHGPHFYQLKTFSLQRATAGAGEVSATLTFDILGRP